MAVGITEPVAELATSSNLTAYSPTTFAPAANSLVIIFVLAVSTATLGGMTGGGVTWTQIYRTLNRAGTSVCFAYCAQMGASPGSITPIFDCSDQPAAAGCLMALFQVTGYDTYNPIRQSKTNVPAVNTTNPTVTLDASMNTSNGYMAAVYSQAGAPTVTPPASWTETMDVGITAPVIGMAAAFRVGGESGSTVTFTGASQTWAVGVVEVNIAKSTAKIVQIAQSVNRANNY